MAMHSWGLGGTPHLYQGAYVKNTRISRGRRANGSAAEGLRRQGSASQNPALAGYSVRFNIPTSHTIFVPLFELPAVCSTAAAARG